MGRDKDGEINLREMDIGMRMEKLLYEDVNAQITAKRRLCGILTAFIAITAVIGIIARIMIRLISPFSWTGVSQQQMAGALISRCSRCRLLGKRVERHQKHRNKKEQDCQIFTKDHSHDIYFDKRSTATDQIIPCSLTSALSQAIGSYLLAVATVLLVLGFHLVPAVFVGLAVYVLTLKLARHLPKNMNRFAISGHE